MREILRICFVGFIVGVLARFFYPGTVHMGLVASIILGLAGSLVGGFVPRLFSPERTREPFSPAGFGGSILGAMGLILIGHII